MSLPPPSLVELGDRLADLRREIARLADLSVPRPAAPPKQPSPREPESALERRQRRVEELDTQIGQLTELREQLRRSLREMITLYDQALARIEAQFDAEVAEPGQPAVHVGVVHVRTAPVHDLQTIRKLERALAQVQGAEGVTVREFVHESVAIQLELSTEVPLISELERVVPFDFSIESNTEAEVVLRLEEV